MVYRGLNLAADLELVFRDISLIFEVKSRVRNIVYEILLDKDTLGT